MASADPVVTGVGREKDDPGPAGVEVGGDSTEGPQAAVPRDRYGHRWPGQSSSL